MKLISIVLVVFLSKTLCEEKIKSEKTNQIIVNTGTGYICECAPRPTCSNCPNMEGMFVNIHDNMLKLAMKDAYNQQDLAHKAKLQVDLFQKAQEFAKEVGLQEMKAKQFANQLNDATRKAQYARAMMFQSTNQARMYLDQTLRAIQPMKCMGPNCAVEMVQHINQMSNSFSNSLPEYNSFIFKQKNLRGNSIK